MTSQMSVPALYEVMPTGVDNQLEATGAVHWFCSLTCRTLFREALVSEQTVEGDDAEYPDATICDECGEML